MALLNGSPGKSVVPVKGKTQLQDDWIMGVGFLFPVNKLGLKFHFINSKSPTDQ